MKPCRSYRGNAGVAVWLAVAFAFAAGVSAQAPRVVPRASPAPLPPAEPPPRAPSTSEGGGKEDVVTYDAKFNNAPLEIVISAYTELTGRTALIAPGTAANVTLQSQTELTREEYIRAIESMLAMHGIALVPFGEKFVKVVRAETARSQGMETILDPWTEKQADTDALISRVIVLKNMEIGEATKLVDGFRSGSAKVQTLDRINGLLITDTAVNINRILQLFEEIDQPVQTREELFVHPVRNTKPSEIKSKLEEIIKDLQQKSEATPTVAMPRPSGPPGVIRARPTEPGMATTAGGEGDMDRGIVRGNVKIVADDRTGILIFITLPANMKFFEDIVKALDIATAPDVLVKVFRLEFADAKKVADMLNSLIGAKSGKDAAGAATAPGGKEGEAKGVALEEYVQRGRQTTGEQQKSKVGELSAENIKILCDDRTNSLIIMASHSDLATLEEIVKDMDMMLSQVLIEAVIIEVDLVGGMQTGIDWLQKQMLVYDKTRPSSARSPIGAFTGRGGGGTLSPHDATTVDSYPGGHGLSYYFTHYGLNVDMVLQMASNDSKTKVLSAPVILTTDNTEAKITATKQIYVYSGKKYDQNQNVYDDYTQRDVGLELTVKPHINKNKVVMMEIKQSMSDPGASGEPKSGAVVSSTRTLNASIAVGDKETIVLGGQIRQDAMESRSKIPFLGSIPLIGRLFSSHSDTSSKTEMIVFITPYVLNTPDEIAAESLRRKRALDIEHEWKRGWSDSKLAEPTRKDKIAARKTERARKAEEHKKQEAEEAARKAEEKRAKEEGKQRLKDEAEAAERKAQAEKLKADANSSELDITEELGAIEERDFSETGNSPAPSPVTEDETVETGTIEAETNPRNEVTWFPAEERQDAEAEAREKERLAAEEARAKAAERERMNAEAEEKARLDAAAKEQERLDAEEKERLDAEAREQARLRAEAKQQERLRAQAERKAAEGRLRAEEEARARAEAEAREAEEARMAEERRAAEEQRLREEQAAADLAKKRSEAVAKEENEILNVLESGESAGEEDRTAAAPSAGEQVSSAPAGGGEQTEPGNGGVETTAARPTSEEMNSLVAEKAARWEKSLKKIDQLTAPRKQ